MKPENTSDSSSSRQHGSQPRSINVPSRDAAANIVRSQLDALYGQDSAASQPTSQPAAKHSTAAPAQHDTTNPPQQLQEYHSAWQEYYQKYYEHYYTSHMRRVMHEQAHKAGQAAGEQPADPDVEKAAKKEQQTEQVEQLRQKLVSNIEKSAKKARKSRHFIPISAAVCVVIVFAFLQYNRAFISNVKAYVTPGSIDPQNIVVDPTVPVEVGPEPKLIIPKINVDVPAVYGIGYDHNSQMAAMEKGVAHFAIPGANSVPGQVGNTVLAGHSSNDFFDSGSYKFIFVQLEKLNTGDMIYANYEGKRYTYSVTKKEVVHPSEVSKLTTPTDKPIMT
ncbi:MAG: sortase [Chloroflexi bacterium]|nr:MAG: sortase [Chloroflexota bacterium]